MRNATSLNLGTMPGVNPDSPAVEDEFSRTRAELEQARGDLRRTRQQVERQQEQHESHMRRTRILSTILGVLIVCLAVSVWYSYPALKEERKAIAEISGLQNVASTLGTRLVSAEAGLREMSTGLPALSSRMDRVQEGMKSGLQSARSYAQSAALQVGQQLQENMARGFQAVQTRMTGLESNQKESAERVVQLEEQVAGLKRDIASMRQESSAAADRIKHLGDVQESSATELSGLTERLAANQAAVGANQSALTTLTSRVERNRKDFEIPTGKAQQIAPGVYFTVKRADVRRQQVDGVLELGQKGSSFAIRAQDVQRPTVFYMQDESRPMEFVVTQVSKQTVSGYVLMPASDGLQPR